MEIKFNGLGKEFPDQQEDMHKPGWVVWRYLKLYDEVRRQNVADWFYVGACSPEYLKSNDSLSDQEKAALCVQDAFDEEGLETFAKTKFEALTFNNWEDFYQKMPEEFVHED